MDKETYRFMYPAGIASLSLVFSQKALQWLCGTTTDVDGRETVNFILFGDLLARMALITGESNGFRRSGAVFRRTAFHAMEHGQEAHTQPAGRAHWNGTYRHQPFKGGIRDDLSVHPWVGNSGWQPHGQYIFP